MEKMSVERNTWVNAPRERVWEAITEPAQILQWMIPQMAWAELKRDDSGKLTLQIGEMANDLAMWEPIDPTRQLRSRSLPDGLSRATYTLADRDGGTDITVKMDGFESLPEAARQDRVQFSNTGWEQTLQNLKSHISGEALPFPVACASPLFGYWRALQQNIGVERSIWINAPRERVWQAITDPKQYQAWFSPTTDWNLFALEVGGRFYVNNPETGGQMYVQVIDALEAPTCFVTKTETTEDDPYVKTSKYILSEEKGGTRLTLTYTGYEPEAEETRWNHMEENAFGFGMMLQNTKAFLEGNPLPFPSGF